MMKKVIKVKRIYVKTLQPNHDIYICKIAFQIYLLLNISTTQSICTCIYYVQQLSTVHVYIILYSCTLVNIITLIIFTIIQIYFVYAYTSPQTHVDTKIKY
jgi:hypothetical protein